MDENGNRRSTEALIAEYNERIANRWNHCKMGSSRHVSRQVKITRIVNELCERADNGDKTAEQWFLETWQVETPFGVSVRKAHPDETKTEDEMLKINDKVTVHGNGRVRGERQD